MGSGGGGSGHTGGQALSIKPSNAALHKSAGAQQQAQQITMLDAGAQQQASIRTQGSSIKPSKDQQKTTSTSATETACSEPPPKPTAVAAVAPEQASQAPAAVAAVATTALSLLAALACHSLVWW